jgi:hypothetical protein
VSVVLQRGPKTEDELYHLVKALWGHTVPRHKVCPEHDAPFDAFCTAYFAREPQILIHGSRGLAGKSRLLSILGLTKAAILGSDVNILGGSLSQSNNIHETMRDAWSSKHAPKYLLKDDNMTLVKLHNGAKIRPLTASQKTVRGPHPPSLLLDEIDEMDQAILDAALGQPMPQQNYLEEWIAPQTTMSSTWQYPDKTFAEMYRRHQDEELPIYTWCYRDTANPVDGWLRSDFIEEKKRQIPAEMWRVEYELGEPSIGNRAFDSEKVEETFSLPAPEGDQIVKVAKDFEQYKFEEYSETTDYVIAADWAKEQDYTVITVYKCSHLPMERVYYLRMRRRPYPVMIEYFNRIMRAYNAEAIHDATGLGNVVQDYLDTRARGFLMTGAKRDNMLTEYVNAVENDKVRSPRISTAYKATLYCSVEDLYARGKEFHLPDEVCADALAWHLVNKRAIATTPIMMPNSGDPNWMEKEMETNRNNNRKSPWVVGQVHKKEEEFDEFSIMV